MWSDQRLEVDGYRSVEGLEGQHHRLELDATGSHWRLRRRAVTWENLGRYAMLQHSGYASMV